MSRNRYNISYARSDKEKRTSKNKILFASLLEKEFFDEVILSGFYKGNKILSYSLQPRFLLQPEFINRDKIKIRKVEYVADFKIIYQSKKTKKKRIVYIDIKGQPTETHLLNIKFFNTYILKRNF